MFNRSLIYTTSIFLLLNFSLSAMDNSTVEASSACIKLFTKDGSEILVPVMDVIKKCSSEVATEAIKNDSPNILKSMLGFAIDHHVGLLQTLGYSCVVGGIISFRYSKYYWDTPAGFDKRLALEKKEIIHALREQKRKNNEAHIKTTGAIKEVSDSILLGYAALDSSIKQNDLTLDTEKSKALQAEHLRRRSLQEEQRGFYDFLDYEAEDLLLHQKSVSNDIASKQKTLTRKHSVLSDEISSLNLVATQELSALETSISSQKKRNNIFHTIESSTSKPIDLEETLAVLDKYGLLKGEVLDDLEVIIEERKKTLSL